MNGLKPLGAIRASTAMLLCCAMLLLGGAAGYTIRGTQQVQIQPPPEETAQEAPAQPEQEPQAEQVAQMGEETVSPDARVLWRYHMACGHVVEREDAQPAIGKTKAELEAAYGVDSVSSFGNAAVVMELESPLCCPDHYLLKLEEGVLTVRKTGDDLQEEILLTLDVTLPPDAAAECEQGLCFDSLEDINVYLEGLDS